MDMELLDARNLKMLDVYSVEGPPLEALAIHDDVLTF
jgi:hypothetical protein